MAKRGAQSEMNHDNWDQEDENEEAGVFKQATQNVLKRREIKKAKRRGVAGQDDAAGDGTGSSTAFKGFSGFVSSNPKPTFSFNKDNAKPLGGFANGGSTPTFSLGGGTTFGNLKPAVEAKSETVKTTESTVNGSGSASRSKYLQQLRALNESVSKWISEHVSKNPHCVLTPIFKDYEKHLVEVEKLNPDSEKKAGQDSTGAVSTSDSTAKEEKEEKSSPVKSTTEAAKSTFSFSSGTSSTSASLEAAKPSIFGASTTSTTPSLFGAPSATPAFGSGFSFKPSSGTTADLKPFSFSTAGASAAAPQAKPEEEEEYEPPKAEVKEITEEDAFYSKKCKLYFQKSGAWTERGVGHIHLKPCGEKTQLIIRADTNLGNILLNIMLSSSIPLARQGKNNVSMMCMANPPIDPKEKDPKPTSFLIRVKTGEEADELLEELKKNQK